MGVVTEQVKKRVEEQRKLLSRVPVAREELRSRQEKNARRIEELQEGMPSLFAAMAMKELQPADAKKAKAEIAKREEENRDIELALQGLFRRERQLEIGTGARRVDAEMREAVELEELMDAVRNGQTAKACQIVGRAKKLGVENIAETFTAEMAAAGISW